MFVIAVLLVLGMRVRSSHTKLSEAIVPDDRLTLPHPRMHERAFVLVPLAELTGGEPARAEGVVLAGPPLRV